MARTFFVVVLVLFLRLRKLVIRRFLYLNCLYLSLVVLLSSFYENLCLLILGALRCLFLVYIVCACVCVYIYIERSRIRWADTSGNSRLDVGWESNGADYRKILNYDRFRRVGCSR